MLAVTLLLAFAALSAAQSERAPLVECPTDDDSVACIASGGSFSLNGEGAIVSGSGDTTGSSKSKVCIEVGFEYTRDDRTEDTRSECGPEVRLVLNDVVLAHTDAEVTAEDVPMFPAEGEGSFEVKVELAPGTYDVEIQYRDGESCDLFDDDGEFFFGCRFLFGFFFRLQNIFPPLFFF